MATIDHAAFSDRVKQTSTTSGTGTLTLATTAAGFNSFATAFTSATTKVYYAIIDSTANTWETGIGTFTLSGTTLSRDTVLESSNSNSLVNFAGNSKDVYVTLPAKKASDLLIAESLARWSFLG